GTSVPQQPRWTLQAAGEPSFLRQASRTYIAREQKPCWRSLQAQRMPGGKHTRLSAVGLAVGKPSSEILKVEFSELVRLLEAVVNHGLLDTLIGSVCPAVSLRPVTSILPTHSRSSESVRQFLVMELRRFLSGSRSRRNLFLARQIKNCQQALGDITRRH